MKKVLLATIAGALCIPALNAQPADMPPAPPTNAPALENPQQGQPGDFKQAREKHEARLKATQEKMTKLVSEYNKMKAGKKKEAKKAEIAQAVAVIYEEQIKFKEKHLADFEKRLEKMKAELAAQKTAEAKKEWVDNRTAELIEANGDMRVLFDTPLGAPAMGQMNRPGGPGMNPGQKGFHHRGPGMKPGEGGPGKQGFRHGGRKFQGPGPEGPQGFVPPEPPAEQVPPADAPAAPAQAPEAAK